VPALATTAVRYLDAQPSDTILDIGCGDGVLTASIAPRCASILGLDSSTSLVATATSTYAAQHANMRFVETDCRRLPTGATGPLAGIAPAGLQTSAYDKVFSNAAMHWILRDATTRDAFFDDVFALLRPGGAFVFEMGGAGNVAEVHGVFIAVLAGRCGVGMREIRRADPWFFPSEAWMRAALERAGFEVARLEVEYRPTRATPRGEDGSGGLEGWVRLMGARFLDLVDEGEKRDDAVRHVCDALEGVMTREEDGSQWFGYVRLRAVAIKPLS